ncbi:MAG: indolepyruvate oxidoreductase subunit beta [Candidatus Omnitrophica bacterium]|nr:indolepyruvate oxidoreductase subunit beta [Candidatus Omnitrophota bacterium]
MHKPKTTNILFCGIGGQGVLKASEVAAWAAVLSGYEVKKSEVHGMAQRGGSVESHVRFGSRVFSPLIPKGRAQFLVPFYAAEAARLKGYLGAAGRDLSSDLEDAQSKLGDRRYVNVFLLGRLSRFLGIKEQAWIAALEAVFAARYLAENKKAFYLGRDGKR